MARNTACSVYIGLDSNIYASFSSVIFSAYCSRFRVRVDDDSFFFSSSLRVVFEIVFHDDCFVIVRIWRRCYFAFETSFGFDRASLMFYLSNLVLTYYFVIFYFLF